MNTPIHPTLVATAGLDLLHSTRLKLACSLLLADRIAVTLEDWNGQVADLVVLGLDAPGARGTLEQLRREGRRVLTISREAGADLRHGATVRDINEAIRLGLLAPAQQPQQHSATVPPLLALCGAAPDSGLQLVCRGNRIAVIDPQRRCLLMAAGQPLDAIVEHIGADDWSVTPLGAQEFSSFYATRLTSAHSFEALFFAVAARQPGVLPAVDHDRPMQLDHWPDLAGDESQTPWLMAIACLHARPWRAGPLAQACKLPLQTVECLFAAALASGIAANREIVRAPSASQRDAGNTRFFSWVARRFGLNLFKAHA